jgi:hypothetical protein
MIKVNKELLKKYFHGDEKYYEQAAEIIAGWYEDEDFPPNISGDENLIEFVVSDLPNMIDYCLKALDAIARAYLTEEQYVQSLEFNQSEEVNNSIEKGNEDDSDPN